MEITFATTLIVDDTLLRPGSGWDLPAQLLVDPVQLPRAADGAFFARGNRTCQMPGSAWHTFDTLGEAVAFWATHARSLPTSGTLTFAVGGVTQATAPAVLQSVVCRAPKGVSVQVDYLFLFPPPTGAS